MTQAATPLPERVAQLDHLHLDASSHTNFEDGHCSMELVSWLAGEGWTDAPECASPVIREYTIALNDRWSNEKRQQLKPYLVRMIGTGDDGKDEIRNRIVRRFLADRLVEPWFEMAGLNDELATVKAATTDAELRSALRNSYDAASRARSAARERLKERILVALRKRPEFAEGHAADTVAVAAAAAAAAADTVADAATAAVAVAVAAADAASQDTWGAVYTRMRAYYREHPLPISEKVRLMVDEQDGLALELLELLIEAREPVTA